MHLHIYVIHVCIYIYMYSVERTCEIKYMYKPCGRMNRYTKVINVWNQVKVERKVAV